MHCFFVPPEQISKEEVTITGSDVNHIRNVLRMQPGDEFHVRTGQDDLDYRCRIESITALEVIGKILWIEEEGAELPSKITLYQSLPKSDKMEWIIQKAVELGAYSIVPVAAARSVVKLHGDKAANKVRRWNAVSESAAKQSRRGVIPQVGQVMSFKEALKDAAAYDVVLIPYELAEDMTHTRQVLDSIRPGDSAAVFIGPEGGFEPEEVEAAIAMGAKSITLGRRILRTETAGMTLLSALMIALEGRTPENITEQQGNDDGTF